jgi:hypothetical protein
LSTSANFAGATPHDHVISSLCPYWMREVARSNTFSAVTIGFSG